MPASVFGFFGSRSLPSVPARGGLVSQAVASVPRSSGVAVGCCVGADAAVLRAAGRLGPAPFWGGGCLSVFAAFGPGGAGSCSLSAVRLVCALAASRWCLWPGVGSPAPSPAEVRWWAGGRASVPLRARLARRSAALVRFVASRPRSLLVGFVAGPPSASRGSWAVVRRGLAAGVPIVLFPVGWSPSSLASVSGSVVSGASFSVSAPGPGVWSRAVAFVPGAAASWFAPGLFRAAPVI